MEKLLNNYKSFRRNIVMKANVVIINFQNILHIDLVVLLFK